MVARTGISRGWKSPDFLEKSSKTGLMQVLSLFLCHLPSVCTAMGNWSFLFHSPLWCYNLEDVCCMQALKPVSDAEGQMGQCLCDLAPARRCIKSVTVSYLTHYVANCGIAAPGSLLP